MKKLLQLKTGVPDESSYRGLNHDNSHLLRSFYHSAYDIISVSISLPATDFQLHIETTDGDITTVAVKMPYKHPNDVSKIISPLIVKFVCMHTHDQSL